MKAIGSTVVPFLRLHVNVGWKIMRKYYVDQQDLNEKIHVYAPTLSVSLSLKSDILTVAEKALGLFHLKSSGGTDWKKSRTPPPTHTLYFFADAPHTFDFFRRPPSHILYFNEISLQVRVMELPPAQPG